MAIKRLLQSWVHRPDRGPMIDICQGGLAASALGVGVLSLVRQSELRRLLELWINIHALFGLLLVGFILVRLAARHRQSSIKAAEIYELSREMSRLMYLILYSVIGFRQIISTANQMLYGGPLDFNLVDEAHKGSGVAGSALNDDCHAFLAAGIAALIVIRVLLYYSSNAGLYAVSVRNQMPEGSFNPPSLTAAVSVKTCSNTAK